MKALRLDWEIVGGKGMTQVLIPAEINLDSAYYCNMYTHYSKQLGEILVCNICFEDNFQATFKMEENDFGSMELRYHYDYKPEEKVYINKNKIAYVESKENYDSIVFQNGARFNFKKISL